MLLLCLPARRYAVMGTINASATPQLTGLTRGLGMRNVITEAGGKCQDLRRRGAGFAVFG